VTLLFYCRAAAYLNKALHRTAIPPRSIAAGELDRYLQKPTNSAPRFSVMEK